MKLQTLKTDLTFEQSIVPNGQILIFYSVGNDGVVARYKDAQGNFGTLSGSGGEGGTPVNAFVLFTNSNLRDKVLSIAVTSSVVSVVDNQGIQWQLPQGSVSYSSGYARIDLSGIMTMKGVTSISGIWKIGLAGGISQDLSGLSERISSLQEDISEIQDAIGDFQSQARDILGD